MPNLEHTVCYSLGEYSIRRVPVGDVFARDCAASSGRVVSSTLLYDLIYARTFQKEILRTSVDVIKNELLSPLINRALACRFTSCARTHGDARPRLLLLTSYYFRFSLSLSLPLPSLSHRLSFSPSSFPSAPTILHAWPATFFVPFMPIFRRAIRWTAMRFSRTRRICLATRHVRGHRV